MEPFVEDCGPPNSFLRFLADNVSFSLQKSNVDVVDLLCDDVEGGVCAVESIGGAEL